MTKAPIYRFNGWKLMMNKRSLYRPDGTHVRLTSNQIDILSIFCAHPQEVLSADDLYNVPEARNIHMATTIENLRIFIHRLRTSLSDFNSETPMIINVRHRGYLFTPDVTVED